ncbi:MAG: acetylglutamate kinase [Actinomycetota bacterium]|nr:MAG: acetylglutamate kinase [Actinomycetota bacterium]
MAKVGVLLESLPYIKKYFNKVVLVKIGGSMMENDRIIKSVLDDLVLMKYVGIKVVLVHGGGKQITKLMEEKGIKAQFVDGLRITTEEVIDIVKMVLLGSINSKLVSFLNHHGNMAVGVSGNDANFIKCSKKIYKKDGREIDLGYVGEIENIDRKFLDDILSDNYIPVIATLGVDGNGNSYNINADSCAADIAISLEAEKMIMLTDVDGIFDDAKDDMKLISRLTSRQCIDMIENGKISSGMIPKVKACMDVLDAGVTRTHILNGTRDHSVLVEIFTDSGIGTMITKKKI